MKNARSLIVVADDYGIGPDVSRCILELMRAGVVTGTVLLVNSPFAESDISRWKQSGRVGEMGWHPNLNLDAPTAPRDQVATLLDREGRLASLGIMLMRMASGRLRFQDLVNEFEAQLNRFCDLVGNMPRLINGHKHIHVFPMVSRALTQVLQSRKIIPYVRRVVEPLACFGAVPGARVKRLFLTTLGRSAARRQDRAGFTGNDALVGITDPKWVQDPAFFERWITRVPGQTVELAVHPGYRDETLVGRDCTLLDGQLERRVAEHRLLLSARFTDAYQRAGFQLATPSNFLGSEQRGWRHAG